MAGMIEVEGAAKFWKNRRSSEKKVRVVVMYTSTVLTEKLVTEKLRGLQLSDRSDNVRATHVVTGITYGSNAFFVFERMLTKTESMEKVTERMKAAITDAMLAGDVIAYQKTKLEYGKETAKYTCTYYGDLKLPSDPNTFEEAIKIYWQLPELISRSDGEKSIPVFITLSPLSDGGHLRPVHSICSELITQVEEILQNFDTMQVCIDDLLTDEACSQFSDVQSQIKKFRMLMKRFKKSFIEKLAAILPVIRHNRAKESDLENLVNSVLKSPFKYENMHQYARSKANENKQLSKCLIKMRDISKLKNFCPVGMLI